MYCYDVCVSVWACVQCSWDVLVKLAGALWPFCKHYRDWVLPPANDTPGGVQPRSPPHLETFKLVSPEATHYNPLLYQNQKYHVQQCNNATLCLSKVGAQPPFFSSRRGGNYICICVSLCGVVMPQVDFIFWGGFVVGCHGRVGGVRTVISHL